MLSGGAIQADAQTQCIAKTAEEIRNPSPAKVKPNQGVEGVSCEMHLRAGAASGKDKQRQGITCKHVGCDRNAKTVQYLETVHSSGCSVGWSRGSKQHCVQQECMSVQREPRLRRLSCSTEPRKSEATVAPPTHHAVGWTLCCCCLTTTPSCQVPGWVPHCEAPP